MKIYLSVHVDQDMVMSVRIGDYLKYRITWTDIKMVVWNDRMMY